MTKNRSNHGFTSDEYRYILLKKLRSVYGGCVPFVCSHYLRHPGDTLKIQTSEEGYKEGSIDIYCSHEKCCGCSCAITITLWSFANHVEARYNINGKRFHRPHCIRRRRVTGKARDEL